MVLKITEVLFQTEGSAEVRLRGRVNQEFPRNSSDFISAITTFAVTTSVISTALFTDSNKMEAKIIRLGTLDFEKLLNCL